MPREKIIYFSPLNAAFVKKDIKKLGEEYEVIQPDFYWKGNHAIIGYLTNQIYFLLRNIFTVKATFIMFGGYWSFFPTLISKILGRPCYIILGGADCVSFPKLNYGSLRLKFLKRIISMSYKMATKLLPVHEALIQSKYAYSLISDSPFQGYKYFLPNVNTVAKVIYNGFDPQEFFPVNLDKINNSFITVALIDSKERFKLKGIDLIFQIAQIHYDCQFTIVGFKRNFLNEISILPKNVTVVEFVDAAELKNILSKHEFYMQFSISEGFPNSLAEGMLCGCCPLGSDVSSIPFIIGDTGFILQRDEVNLLDDLFKCIKTIPSNERVHLGKMARERIIKNFHIDLRAKEFQNLIHSNGIF